MSWILKVIIILLLFTVGAICIVNAVTYQKISTVKEEDLPSDISKGGALALMWFNIIFATLTIIAGIWMFWARTIESAKKEKVLEAVSQSYNRGLVAARRSFAPYARTPKTMPPPDPMTMGSIDSGSSSEVLLALETLSKYGYYPNSPRI